MAHHPLITFTRFGFPEVVKIHCDWEPRERSAVRSRADFSAHELLTERLTKSSSTATISTSRREHLATQPEVT